jgi:hypothetical protein
MTEAEFDDFLRRLVAGLREQNALLKDANERLAALTERKVEWSSLRPASNSS